MILQVLMSRIVSRLTRFTDTISCSILAWCLVIDPTHVASQRNSSPLSSFAQKTHIRYPTLPKKWSQRIQCQIFDNDEGSFGSYGKNKHDVSVVSDNAPSVGPRSILSVSLKRQRSSCRPNSATHRGGHSERITTIPWRAASTHHIWRLHSPHRSAWAKDSSHAALGSSNRTDFQRGAGVA